MNAGRCSASRRLEDVQKCIRARRTLNSLRALSTCVSDLFSEKSDLSVGARLLAQSDIGLLGAFDIIYSVGHDEEATTKVVHYLYWSWRFEKITRIWHFFKFCSSKVNFGFFQRIVEVATNTSKYLTLVYYFVFSFCIYILG